VSFIGFSTQKPVPGVPGTGDQENTDRWASHLAPQPAIPVRKTPAPRPGVFRIYGAEGRTRTGTSFRPPPPQDGVSTKFHHFGTTILYQSDAGSSSPKKCAAASIRSLGVEFVIASCAGRGISLPAMSWGKVLRDTECVLSGLALFLGSTLIAIRGNEVGHLFVWTYVIKNLLF
jgi:hypothetical protein